MQVGAQMSSIKPKELESAAAATPEDPVTQQMVQVQVDDSSVVYCYANFCRVTGSPEELLIDFGLNPQPVGIPSTPIEVQQRVVVNYYTAKRLVYALQMSVHRHEAVFGVIDTNIASRLRSHPLVPSQTEAELPPPYAEHTGTLPVRLQFEATASDAFVDSVIKALRTEVEREGGTLLVSDSND